MQTIHREPLHPVQKDEFLPPISPWITLGGIVLVVLFSIAFYLASILKFKIAVKAPAVIRPEGELRIIQSVLEGTIKQVAVKENQLLKKGDVVAYLDDSQLQTTARQILGDIQRTEIQLIQFKTQLQALDNQIVAESDLRDRSIKASEASLDESQRRYRELKISTQADLDEARASHNLAREELGRYRQLEKGGAIALLQVKEKEAELRVTRARIRRFKSAINPTDAEVVRAKERIAQERARGQVTLSHLYQQREHLLRSRIDILNKHYQTQQQLQQLNANLAQSVIRAPNDGVLLQLNLRNSGQVVQAGETIGQIAPLNASLTIKAQISAQDINKIEIGQAVQMRVSACPYTEYGTLQGQVSNISPDAISEGAKKGTGRPTTGFYQVLVRPDTRFVGDADHPCHLQLGMEGSAEIISHEETVLQFILKKARLLTSV